MTGEVYRNHFTKVISNILTGLIFLLFFISINWVSLARADAGSLSVGAILAFIVIYMAVSIRVWRLTTYTFTDTGMTVMKNTLFKQKKELRYDRLSYVSVKRSFWNKVFDTSTLCFNVNSSVGYGRPEATLVLKVLDAAVLREKINSRMFGKNTTSVQEDFTIPSMVKVTNAEIVVHSFLSQRTASVAFSLFMLAISAIGLAGKSSGGFILGAIGFVYTQAIPVVRAILSYGNYRLYRIGDTITVQCGLITTARISFKVGRINSVRMRSPLFAGLLGMSTLEAEVVGMKDSQGLPLLCPLKKKAEVKELFARLLPEFYFEGERKVQERCSLKVMALLSIPAAAIAPVPFIYGYRHYEDFVRYTGLNFSWMSADLVLAAGIAAAAIVMLNMLCRYRVRSVMLGEDLFMIGSGGFDLSEDYLAYDRVQISDVGSGPVQRRYGIASLRVRILSSSGSRTVRSGLFDERFLEQVPCIVSERIRDGRYDYRRYL